MTTRKRVRPSRAPRRVRLPPKRKRRLGAKAAAERASRLPHHPRYTQALLAQVRRRFEETPEPIPSMAADLGIAPGSLHRIARRYGWVRRNRAPPPRDVAPALRILQEAQALEARTAATADVEDKGEAVPRVTLPLVGRVAGRSSRSEQRRARWGSESLYANAVTPTPDPSPQGGGEGAEFAAPAPPGLTSTIARLERAVLAELATLEAMRAALGTLPQKPSGAALTVRTLGMLTQTLQHLQRLRASEALAATPLPESEKNDDDMPRDIDEFRRDLARRIDAFVASRLDARDAGGDPRPAAVDEA